ncbi:response regulator [Christiangramia sp. SM2212]|uniref:Response regulator n=1 Tax=Christiangramia sediminicola TaxID=3073267 RepID=A0ABU1ELC7_9FLAO|nr:response regulator [Christiangramia sp. SM2212]MDR5589063.1 response regulator [Christiangramia sp. SM2212]
MSLKHRILVIDDDLGIGDMMKLILEFNEYSVIVSEKADETENFIIENDIEVVILDMLISGVNGTEVCKRIRNNADTKISEIPILMMSALHDAVTKCKQAGANDFIAKPFDMDHLIQKVNFLVKS